MCNSGRGVGADVPASTGATLTAARLLLENQTTDRGRRRLRDRRSRPISTTRARFRAAIVLIAPAALLAGFIYHPYVTIGTDEAALADAAASDTMRWGLSHLAIGIGYALLALAFIAIRSYLREAGEERASDL